jgi:hypothetical protein
MKSLFDKVRINSIRVYELRSGLFNNLLEKMEERCPDWLVSYIFRPLSTDCYELMGIDIQDNVSKHLKNISINREVQDK